MRSESHFTAAIDDARSVHTPRAQMQEKLHRPQRYRLRTKVITLALFLFLRILVALK